ncbi:hypothetical protein Acr_09g0002200 [Actinidia rufa]|uniref:Retrotransposon gag domain-containing protein n=1 Tax=Actinidia rufa TaxID=165716 RepID=A0A7J0F513_9ERIC|nr:hypothetical protein Acr_09g0002200 [Actinidia rufa]
MREDHAPRARRHCHVTATSAPHHCHVSATSATLPRQQPLPHQRLLGWLNRKCPNLFPSSLTNPTIVSGPQPCSGSSGLGNFGNTSPAVSNHPIFPRPTMTRMMICMLISSIHSPLYSIRDCQRSMGLFGERYSSVDGANEYQLSLELHHLRFDSGQTLTEFYNKMSNLWNHLAQFEPTWTCPLMLLLFLPTETDLGSANFLMALLTDYEHIRASLLHRHPLPTVGQALAELRSEETRKKTMVYQHSQPVLATPVWAPPPPPSSSQPVRVPSSKNIPSGSQKKYCSFCRRDTHSYEDCRSRPRSKRKGYHNRQTAAVTDSSGPSPDSSSSTLTAADVETIVTQPVAII